MTPAILNRSEGNWVFEDLAEMLSRSLWVDVSESIGKLNYILCAEPEIVEQNINSFIPVSSIKIAADKREVERRFASKNVARPKTFILALKSEVQSLLQTDKSCDWILKYPTGCGGMHHRIISDASEIPEKWDEPFLMQEFIKCERPKVYRFYCVDGDLCGFNVRKFTSSEVKTPWVSHANGARYSYDEKPDREAIEVAKAALIATGLYESFGVVDLIRDVLGKWYALEVGTDGIYNHVDRDIDNESLLEEINERIAIAFWKRIRLPPWGNTWRYRK